MNKMKKITATAAAMAISAGLAVGGTLAYLNSVTETKTNTFTSGKNITTTLTETEWTTDSGKNYTPGDVIRKNPVMKNESDQAVYMAIKVDYTDAQGSLMSAEAFEKYASDDAGTILDGEYNIAVRTGYHCAPLVHDVIGSKKYGGTIRISIGRYTTKEDIDRLVSAFEDMR